MSRHVYLLSGLIFGALLGVVLHPFHDLAWLTWLNQNLLYPLGQIFLRLIFMIVVPLVFSALVLGVLELGRGHGFGKVFSRTLIWTVVASTLSVAIGLSLVNAFKPGAGFNVSQTDVSSYATGIAKVQKTAGEAKSFRDSIVELVPINPLDTATRALSGDILPFMVFALIFGLALSGVLRAAPQEQGSALVRLLEEVFAVSLRIIEYAMRLAPVAIFAIIFNTVFNLGAGVLRSLLYYMLVVIGGLAIQQFGVYVLLLKYAARRSPWAFFKQCREVYLYAFSTSSSNATLPVALETAEKKLRLPPHISRFVLTVGATANQNGTALFEGVTVLFLAQVYNVDLTWADQLKVIFMAILAGIGTAGVPSGSLPLIAILLHSVGVPPAGIGLILGADRLLDMCRTVINVSGDLVITAIVSRDVAPPDDV